MHFSKRSNRSITSKNKKIESRKKRFSTEYGKEIDWLSSNPYVEGNITLENMLRILTSGFKEFNNKMNNNLRRYMENPTYQVADVDLKDESILRKTLSDINRCTKFIRRRGNSTNPKSVRKTDFLIRLKEHIRDNKFMNKSEHRYFENIKKDLKI